MYAFLRGAGTKEYYVATAADKVFMAPEDELDVKGLRAELMFVKGTLDKLGVEMEFEHVGKYKDAPDMFTRTSSPETLEVSNQILDQFYGDIIKVIAEGRKKAPDAVRALIDDGPFVGKRRSTGGLVDALIFEDEMYGQLKQQLKLEPIREDRGAGLFERGGYAIWVWTGKRRSRSWWARAKSRAGAPTIQGNDGITAAGMIKLMRAGARRRFDQGRDFADRFSGRRRDRVGRHSARGETAEPEEADW